MECIVDMIVLSDILEDDLNGNARVPLKFYKVCGIVTACTCTIEVIASRNVIRILKSYVTKWQ